MRFIQLILVCSLAAAALPDTHSDADKRLKRRKSLSWWQEQYYHSKWQPLAGRQRFRFTTTAVPGATPEWKEVRMVYPCYCYKPPQEGEATTEAYERYMVEREDLFILNK